MVQIMLDTVWSIWWRHLYHLHQRASFVNGISLFGRVYPEHNWLQPLPPECVPAFGSQWRIKRIIAWPLRYLIMGPTLIELERHRKFLQSIHEWCLCVRILPRYRRETGVTENHGPTVNSYDMLRDFMLSGVPWQSNLVRYDRFISYTLILDFIPLVWKICLHMA